MRLPSISAALSRFATTVVLLVSLIIADKIAIAEPIKIGVFKIAAAAPVFIAQEKGYFAKEGVPAELVYFEAGPPLASAVASGSIDFAADGTTAALFNLAGQGALRIIGGMYSEAPGFVLLTVVASNHAYDNGLKSLADLANHTVAIQQAGGAADYSLSLIEEKYRIAPSAVRRVVTQSVPNSLAALLGGQADFSVLPITAVSTSIRRGEIHLLGTVGDETPWQLGAVATSTSTANQRATTVRAFLRALQSGFRDYAAAFIDQNGHRTDGPSAPEILAIIAKYVAQPPEQIATGLTYVDAAGRLDVQDIYRQIEWYKAQGAVKGQFQPQSLIDGRYVVPLPQR
jgi:NitT/TauT family transport system substrate-binding protein